MCELAGVSRASFYRDWYEKAPAQSDTALRNLVQKAALRQRHFGYRRIGRHLRKRGCQIGDKTVRRLMHSDNLLAVAKRKFTVTTDSNHRMRVWPNLSQYLELNATNQLWVADLTYIRLKQEFVFLGVVLDAYSRRVVGWALGRTLDSHLALTALNRAITSRNPPRGLVHHSDRGSQYASDKYVERLESIGAALSMSRPGRPWENGKCESFIKTLKKEEIDARPYNSLEQLERQVNQFIRQVYNRVRMHSALDYLSPDEFEREQEPTALHLPAALSLPRHEEIYPDA